jgi:hypothetical protein
MYAGSIKKHRVKSRAATRRPTHRKHAPHSRPHRRITHRPPMQLKNIEIVLHNGQKP